MDGLRGFAFLIVYLAHLKPIINFHISPMGKTGVWLFFVLSSFLLTSQFLSSFQYSQSKIKYWMNYLLRRFLRIYPMFFIVLLLDLIFFKTTGISSLESIGKHLLLIQGEAHYWTIPVEFQFYFILPIILIFIEFIANKFKENIQIPILLLLIVISWITFPTSDLKANDINTFLYLNIFLVGIICAYANQNLSGRLQKVLKNNGFIISLILFLIYFATYRDVVLFFKPTFNFPTEISRLLAPLYGLLWGLLILVFTISKQTDVRRIFESKLMTMIGKISYPAYLIHFLIINYVVTNYSKYSSLTQFMIVNISVFTFSLICHYLIELKFNKIHL